MMFAKMQAQLFLCLKMPANYTGKTRPFYRKENRVIMRHLGISFHYKKQTICINILLYYFLCAAFQQRHKPKSLLLNQYSQNRCNRDIIGAITKMCK